MAKLLIQRDAPIDAQGKNGVTPLHVAAHYDHINVALLLLESGASPHAAAKVLCFSLVFPRHDQPISHGEFLLSKKYEVLLYIRMLMCD